MTQYISKSVLVAEVKRRREYNAKERYFGRLVEDNYFLDFLDTFEVKEVDLEKEITLMEEKYYGFESLSRADIIEIIKHFFELGMQVSNKAHKGEKI